MKSGDDSSVVCDLVVLSYQTPGNSSGDNLLTVFANAIEARRPVLAPSFESQELLVASNMKLTCRVGIAHYVFPTTEVKIHTTDLVSNCRKAHNSVDNPRTVEPWKTRKETCLDNDKCPPTVFEIRRPAAWLSTSNGHRSKQLPSCSRHSAVPPAQVSVGCRPDGSTPHFFR